VVVTRKKVRCKVTGGTTDGWADPGWRWLVTDVTIDNRTVTYEVVSESAPEMYHQLLRESQIAKSVPPKVK
jgi:hypothetical protein